MDEPLQISEQLKQSLVPERDLGFAAMVQEKTRRDATRRRWIGYASRGAGVAAIALLIEGARRAGASTLSPTISALLGENPLIQIPLGLTIAAASIFAAGLGGIRR